MAETGVWAPCESPAHAASMEASTSDADLMVTVGDRVVVVAKQKAFTIRPQATGCGCLLKGALTGMHRVHLSTRSISA